MYADVAVGTAAIATAICRSSGESPDRARDGERERRKRDQFHAGPPLERRPRQRAAFEPQSGAHSEQAERQRRG